MDEFTLSRIQEIFSYFLAHFERAEEKKQREKTPGTPCNAQSDHLISTHVFHQEVKV